MSIDIDVIATPVDYTWEYVLGGGTFLYLIFGSIFHPLYFISVLIAIGISIFFPPIIIAAVFASILAIFYAFGLLAAIIYTLGAIILVFSYLLLTYLRISKSYI